MKKSEEIVMFNVKVPRELRDAFNEICKSQDLTGSQVVRKFLTEFIKKHKVEN